MAETGWTKQVAAATAVAAGTGAAQLGIGYGLGIVRWPTAAVAGSGPWLASLGWATWIAAGSTVFGAVAGSRVRPAGAFMRIVLALAGAIGALLTVALIAVPARSVASADALAAPAMAAGYACLGVLVGLLVACWAAGSRPIAANLLATAAWLWLLAIAAVVIDVTRASPDADLHLGSWGAIGPTGHFFGSIYWPGALLQVGAALLIGLIAAWPAARRGERGVGAVASGAMGPLLVAIAYLALSPQLPTTPGILTSAYLVAPYGVLAGLAGSALAVVLGAPRTDKVRRSAVADPDTAPPATTGAPDEDGTATSPESLVDVPVGAGLRAPDPTPAPVAGVAARADDASAARAVPAPAVPAAAVGTAPAAPAPAPAAAKPVAPAKPVVPAAAATKPVASKPAAAPAIAGQATPAGITPTQVNPSPAAAAPFAPVSTPTGSQAAGAAPAATNRRSPAAGASGAATPSPFADGTSKPAAAARSTVTPPPPNPTVAAINQVRFTAPDGQPGATAPVPPRQPTSGGDSAAPAPQRTGRAKAVPAASAAPAQARITTRIEDAESADVDEPKPAARKSTRATKTAAAKSGASPSASAESTAAAGTKSSTESTAAAGTKSGAGSSARATKATGRHARTDGNATPDASANPDNADPSGR